jgi:DNA/RNA endonuclease G (NUC1)/PKD repeat protein
MLTKLLRAAGPLVLAFSLISCSDSNVLAPSADARHSVTAAAAGGVVISQVYGGGGNSGATLKNDFIELFNAGTTEVNLAGWSVQYASAAGTSWQVTPLTGTIAPGGYFLVQEAAGAAGTVALPTPNVIGTIPMGAGASKIALVNNSTALTGACPLAGAVDFVGIGTANCFEGTGGTPASSNTLAVLRKNDGCTDSNVNSADFSALAPAPRNSSSPTKTCGETPVPVVASVAVEPAAPAITVGTVVALAATARDGSGNAVAGTTFTWSTSDAAIATVDAAGAVTGVATGSASITATAPNGVAGSATVTVSAAGGSATSVRVTEVHYDNDGTDANEGVEIEGNAGGSLAGWSLVLYSGSTGSATQGQSYGTPIALSGTIAATCGARGVVVVSTPGLQNGDKDGFALVDNNGTVVEFLSYEGSFTATNGPAAGMTSTDIGVSQASSTAAGRSLQRAGNGTWFGPSAATFGACNPATPPLPTTGITFTGRHPTTDPALPVGFQDQLFATLRDAGTGATIPTTFAWSSETPAIATVDADGVITGRAAGTAVFRATATDGSTATYSLPIHVAVASETAQYGHNAEFGEPTDGDASDDQILRYAQFTSSWNRNRGTPNWVAYNIDATHFGAEDRCDCFTYDPGLPAAGSYTTANYTGAGTFHGYGIDRGHLARSFDRTAASFDNAHTYYFSNIIPQAADNNQGPWALMENYLGDLARRDNKEVFVIAGVAGSKGTIKNEGRITIPAQTWKVAVFMPRDKGLGDVDSADDIEVVAVIMPNDAGIRNVPWDTYKTTVDAVEAISGYDLLAALPNRIEAVVESGTRAPVANAGGPYIGTEGSPVFLSGNDSSDPDGDAITYAWEFGDGTTGTGIAPSHTYADNGTYLVKLTVTDTYGAESTVTTSVVVANVDPTVHVFAGATLLQGETFTGSTTFTDPGADSWTATVDYGDGSGAQPLAISGKTVSLSHRYTTAGSYTVTVTVRDNDGGTGTRTATVVVQSPVQGIGNLQTLVSTLARTGSLNAGNANALDAKLRAAAASLERGNTTSAINQLEAFINQVNALGLSPAETDGLIAAARRIIASI